MTTVLRSFLLPLMVVLCDGERNGKPITCHAGTFAPGDQAKVTCNLHAVNTTGAGVNVVRYPPGASEHNPGDNILFCSWHKYEHKHHCRVEKYCSSDDGCRYNGSVGDTVTVIFPSVSYRHAGLYMCFLLPSAGTDPHGCELLVKENLDKRSTVSPVLSCSDSDGQPDKLLPVVIFLGLYGLAVSSLVVFAIIYLRGLSQRCKRMELHKFLILSVCLLLVIGSVSDASSSVRHITCNAGIYALGETATVVCNLHADMTASKLSLTISRYTLSDVNDLGTDIVVCKWKERTKQHDCEVNEGYKFSHPIADHPEVKIPSVNQSFAGLYSCFNLPSEKTVSHACELIVNETELGTSTSPRCKDDTTCTSWIIPVVVLVLVILGVIMYTVWRCRKKRIREEDGELRRRGSTEEHIELLTTSVSPEKDDPVTNTPKHDNKEVEKYLKGFRLTDDACEQIVVHVQEYIEKRLSEPETGALVRVTDKAAKSLKDMSEHGITAVAFNSSFLTIVLIKPEKEQQRDAIYRTYEVPKDFKCRTGRTMFEFIAQCIDDFASYHKQRQLCLWFIVSFPCRNESLTTVRLTKWTKEFNCDTVVGGDLECLLRDAIEKKNRGLTVEIKVIVNNAVATLVPAAGKDMECSISIFVGNGFNMCYLQERGAWLQGDSKDTVIFCAEIGAVGEKNHCLREFRTEFDQDVDACSVHKLEQIMEKMVGSMYIAMIVQSVLKKLIDEELLFHAVPSDNILLGSLGELPADYVALIESGADEDFFTVKYVLDKLKVTNYTKEDCELMRLVCRLVSKRAAVLVACALEGLIKCMKLDKKPCIKVVVDGHLFQNHLCFRKCLCEELQKKLKQVEIISTFSGNEKGYVIADSVASLARRK